MVESESGAVLAFHQTRCVPCKDPSGDCELAAVATAEMGLDFGQASASLEEPSYSLVWHLHRPGMTVPLLVRLLSHRPVLPNRRDGHQPCRFHRDSANEETRSR